RALLLTRLATKLQFAGDPERTMRVGQEAIEVARRAGDLEALGEAMNGNFLGRGGFSSTEERLASAEEVLRIAEATGSLEGRFWGHWQRLGAFLGIGDVAGVDVELADVRFVAEG